MKTVSLVLLLLTVASGTMAATEPPSPSVCKADLKTWSLSKTEPLTIDQVYERMNTMLDCADDAHHHHHSNKKMLAYLMEFYRVHTELAHRSFDFIMRHNLQDQFHEEENGASNVKSGSKG
jgi:hypothetical protein